MRALDAKVLEQELALRGVARPGERLDPAARAAALAAVEEDAAEVLREVIEDPRALVDARGAPLLHRAVEAARREHEERRPVACDLVVGADAVERDFSHCVAP